MCNSEDIFKMAKILIDNGYPDHKIQIYIEYPGTTAKPNPRFLDMTYDHDLKPKSQDLQNNALLYTTALTEFTKKVDPKTVNPNNLQPLAKRNDISEEDKLKEVFDKHAELHIFLGDITYVSQDDIDKLREFYDKMKENEDGCKINYQLLESLEIAFEESALRNRLAELNALELEQFSVELSYKNAIMDVIEALDKKKIKHKIKYKIKWVFVLTIVLQVH
jgi:hypothetical protein